MEKGRPSEEDVSKEHQIRHLANLRILHGFFYHGVYYLRGHPQPHHNRGNIYDSTRSTRGSRFRTGKK